MSEPVPVKKTGTIYFYDEVDSTNDVARALAHRDAHAGLAVVADTQRRGRGQKGRVWHSPAGEGLYFSLILRPKVVPRDLTIYVRRIAEVTAKMLRTVHGIEVGIEWPNDLILEGKKVGGILLEAVTQGEKTAFLIAGIGLNLNQTLFPDHLRGSAISLRMHAGKAFDREAVARDLQEALSRELC